MSTIKKECPLVYIITINYNNFNITSEFLNSINNLTYSNYRVLIVDDCSTDDSADKIEQTFPGIALIRNEKNILYCKSFNTGIREALRNDANYVFIVNNDTKDFSSNYLEEMVRAFDENDSIGMVGSWCNDYERGARWDGTTKDKFGIPMEIPTEGYVIKRDVFEKIGLFDEKLVIYFEDLDLIARLRDAGYKTEFVPSVSFSHLGGASTSKKPFMANYYRVRNLIWIMKRYCADKPFKLNIKYFIIGLEPHIRRLVDSFIRLNFKTFVIISCSVFSGIITGSIMNWNYEKFNQ